MNYIDKIHTIGNLLNFINSQNTFSDKEDIRNITIDAFAQNTQNFFIALNLAKKLENIHFVNIEISEQFIEDDLEIVNYSFDGFIKDAYFVKSFILLENHIRQIASFYERTPNNLNVQSINSTIKNVTDNSKLSFMNISKPEIEILLFFCYLRNTMHNIGFQTQTDKQITLNDSFSVISTDNHTLELKQNGANKNTFIEFVLLIEQVIKILIKIDSQLPINDKIEHRLNTIAY